MSVPLTKAKARLSGLVERLFNVKEHIVITKHGRPVAALIPFEDWERLAVAKAGGLASVPPPAEDHDEEIDAMVDAVYEARTRSLARKPSL